MDPRHLVPLLLALAFAEGVHGLVAGISLGATWALDPTRWWPGSAARGGLVALAFLAGSALVAVGALAAAVGLAQERPWGRRAALAVGFASLLTGCAPVGAALVVALLIDSPHRAGGGAGRESAANGAPGTG